MTDRDIVNWLISNFKVEHIGKAELKFPCPECEHSNHYFNFKKKIGWCHRASCHASLTLEDLIDRVGFGPDFAGYVPGLDNMSDKTIARELVLPPGLTRLTVETNPSLCEYLNTTRGITQSSIEKYNFLFNKHRLVVPIYEDGKLVQYVGRSIEKTYNYRYIFTKNGQRYLYGTNAPITNYLFNWDEAKYWDTLVLVENTFNAIWLQSLMFDTLKHTTTNFGSYLSDIQIEKIVNSPIRYVVFMWDQGTEEKAYEARRKLEKKGVLTFQVILKSRKQPDDYNATMLKSSVELAILNKDDRRIYI